jgi:hypothetical protein
MKRLILACALLLFSIPAFAGHFGPAEPLAKPGNFSLGTGIFFYSAEWEDDVDVEQIQPYVQAGLGIAPNWEIYTQLGASDIDLDANGGGFEDGYRPFATVGIRGLFTKRTPVGFGAFVQGTYFSSWEDTDPVFGDVEIEKSYEINGGLVLEGEIEGAILYGGPVFFLRDSDVKAAGVSDSIEEDSNFGGFIGIRWPLKNGLAVELETQIKTDISAGGAIHFIF